MQNIQIRVLLIEDNPGGADLVKKALSKAKTRFDVRHVGRLSDALEQLGSNEFEMILVDLSLPDSCGVETVTAIRNRVSDVPLVVLTSLASDKAALASLDQGAQEYLVEDCLTTEVLERVIQYAIRRKQSEIRQNSVTKAVNEIFEKALACDTEQEVAKVCLAVAERLTGSKYGWIGEVNRNGRMDTIAISDPGWTACRMPEAQAVKALRDQELRSYWGRGIREQKSVIVNEPATHPDRAGTPVGHPEITSFLGVPLRWQGKTIGMIALGNKRAGYDAADQQAVEAIAVAFAEALMHKRTQRELRDSKHFLQTVIDALLEPVLVIDVDYRIVLANRTAREKFGGEDPVAKGMACHQFSHQRDILCEDSAYLCPHDEVIATKAPVTVTHTHFDRDGNESIVEINAAPIFDKAGEVVQVVEACRDITQRVRTEEALRKKEGELRQSQKLEAVGHLAGGIAHEFNNLLQAMQGYTRFAMEGLPPDEQRYEDLGRVVQATQRATTLTHQLLGFSRRQLLQRKRLAVNDLANDVVKLLSPLIGEHIDHKTILDEGAGTVNVDPGEFQQVLVNLCLNARDAMPSGGELVLKTEGVVLSEAFCEAHENVAPGQYTVLSVSDTGCGMPPEVKERAFEPFFTTKDVGKGTGLGLATVYGIVQQHGGAIYVYSEPGQGTVFKIYLPTVDSPAENGGFEQPAPARGGHETILVAEDEPVVQDIVTRVLQESGYTVLLASDGEEALRVFHENRSNISLALLDAVMPKLNGREVCRRIRAECPETKVVFCTGYDPETAQSQSIVDDNLRLVQKPVSPEDLLDTVRDVLDSEVEADVAVSV